jgi:ATP-dependent Lhr-like helicase
VHLGLASLLAWRLSRTQPTTFSMSFNDYGFELLAAEPLDIRPLLDQSVFDDGELLHDVLASLNSGELALRRFRAIARVAGLVFTGYPGAPKSTKQLQASSSLFHEVFRKYDPANMLDRPALRVLAQELDIRRLRASLKRMRTQRIEAVTLRVPSPFALALMVERFREELSTEKLADRLARILKEANAQLDAPAPADRPSPRKARAPRRKIDA